MVEHAPESPLGIGSALEDEAAEMPEKEDNPYWAKERDGKALITILREKEQLYFDAANRRGYMEMWQVMLEEYFGISPGVLGGFEAHGVDTYGEEGELVRFRVNEMRPMIRQNLTFMTKNRPAFQVLATNSDFEAMSQVDAAEAAVSYIYEESYGERKEMATAEKAELFAKGWTWLQWDPNGGPEIDVSLKLPDGSDSPATEKKKTGELIIKSLAPWEVAHDATIQETDTHYWRIVRERRSKWEIAAIHPQFAEDIKKLSAADEIYYTLLFGFDDEVVTDDDVIVKHFYHDKSAAIPKGRYVQYVGDILLSDGDLQDEEIPLVELQNSEMPGNGFGYSDAWDLLPMTQMLTQLTSDYATNLSNFGRASLVVDEGTDINADSLANGMTLLEIPVGSNPPQLLTLAALPDVGIKFADWVIKRMSVNYGLDDIVRGDPSSSITSGTMAALFHSIYQEKQHGREAALDLHRERVANRILDIVKHNAEYGMIIEIIGQDERQNLQRFTKQKFMGIRKVRVKTADPMMKSPAGRMEAANFIKASVPSAIKTPAMALEVLKTGQLKPLFKAAHTELLHVTWENEQLSNGALVQEVPADPDPLTGQVPIDPATGMPATRSITPELPVMPNQDPHVHVPEHMALLNSPEAIHDEKVRSGVLAHVQWHISEYQKGNPMMAMLMGFPPAQALMGGGAPPDKPSGKPDGEGEPPPRPKGDMGVALPEPAAPPGEKNPTVDA